MKWKCPTDYSKVIVVKKITLPSLIKKPVPKDIKPVDVK